MEHRDTGDTGAIQEATQEARAAADEAARNAGDRLESAAGRLRAQLPDNGIAGEAADRFTQGVKQAATSLQEQGVGGMIDEVITYARRYPMQAFFVGLGCAYLLSRFRRD
jgi:hypothetical protein